MMSKMKKSGFRSNTISIESFVIDELNAVFANNETTQLELSPRGGQKMRTRKEIIEELSKAIEKRKEADAAINALSEELKSFDEIPALPSYREGDDCYYLDETFNTILGRIKNPDAVHWNMFPTQEYAEEFAHHAILFSKLLHCRWYLDRDYKPDWKTGELKFSIVYQEEKRKFAVDTLVYSDHGTVCFSTRELAERAAAWMDEHALDELEGRK